MRAILTLICLAALAGCAQVHKTHGLDGREVLTITCNGSMNDWTTCYQAANKQCGVGRYDRLPDISYEDGSGKSYNPFGGSCSGYDGTTRAAASDIVNSDS